MLVSLGSKTNRAYTIKFCQQHYSDVKTNFSRGTLTSQGSGEYSQITPEVIQELASSPSLHIQDEGTRLFRNQTSWYRYVLLLSPIKDVLHCKCIRVRHMLLYTCTSLIWINVLQWTVGLLTSSKCKLMHSTFNLSKHVVIMLISLPYWWELWPLFQPTLSNYITGSTTFRVLAITDTNLALRNDCVITGCGFLLEILPAETATHSQSLKLQRGARTRAICKRNSWVTTLHA